MQEHHLQRAISAQQVFREKKESMVIPVPEAESNVHYYSRLYKGEFKQPKQFIHIQRKCVRLDRRRVLLVNIPVITQAASVSSIGQTTCSFLQEANFQHTR